MGDVLDLIGVTVVRNESTLLDEVTWTVRDGERWVLLGPNGAGKTTLLQIAGARLHPTRGSARILDETLGSVDVFELRPRIGLSSAAFAETLPGHERVADVVLTAAYAVAGRWRESYDPLDHRRSSDLLAAFGVAHLADRTFGTLSEGERKRVQLARSLMTDPELVLLDEPAAGLDLGGRETLVQDLAELAKDRRSPVLILVTHHVEEIPPGFTHALLLRKGRVVAAGPIDDVLTDETLTATFDVPLAVQRVDDRWSARIRTGREAQAVLDDLPVPPTQPVADEPVADEPVVDEPVVDEPVVDEASVAEAVADQPVAGEPVEQAEAEQPVAEDGAAGRAEPAAQPSPGLSGTAWGAERPTVQPGTDGSTGTAEPVADVSSVHEDVAAASVVSEPEWVSTHHG